MSGRVAALFAYPVKGLTGQSLEVVLLTPGQGMPGDRRYALARSEGTWCGVGPVSKDQFYTLATCERLAGLRIRWDAGTDTVRVFVREHAVLVCDLGDADGRAEFARFFARVLDLPAGRVPLLATGRRFTDAAALDEPMAETVSLINLATVREIEQRTGRPLDPRRFRANIYCEGLPAWSEVGRVGDEVIVGNARLRVDLDIPRCAATEVDPDTGVRDVPLPRLLKAEYGHVTVGVLASVVAGGRIAAGAPVAFLGPRR